MKRQSTYGEEGNILLLNLTLKEYSEPKKLNVVTKQSGLFVYHS